MCINFNAEDVESIKTMAFCGFKGVEYTRDQLNGIKWMCCHVYVTTCVSRLLLLMLNKEIPPSLVLLGTNYKPQFILFMCVVDTLSSFMQLAIYITLKENIKIKLVLFVIDTLKSLKEI